MTKKNILCKTAELKEVPKSNTNTLLLDHILCDKLYLRIYYILTDRLADMLTDSLKKGWTDIVVLRYNCAV